jgi:hypothetical protein
MLFIGGTALAARFVGNAALKDHLDNAPTMESFLEECLRNVKWTYTKGQFEPVSVQLDNALIIAGKLV